MNKHNIVLGVAVAIAFLGLAACRQDHKPSVEPSGNNCETTNISFADVKPIFDRNCNGCHNDLETEATAKAWGNFNAIVGAIKHDPANVAMPMGGAKLTDCEIKKIEAWYQKVK